MLRIERGHFGDIPLDGLKVALLYAWPGPIFEGKGEMQVIVDERANEHQRDALMKIVHGEETDEGATHWWVYRSMTDTVHETLVKPIEFEVDLEARKARVMIPGVLESIGPSDREPRDRPGAPRAHRHSERHRVRARRNRQRDDLGDHRGNTARSHRHLWAVQSPSAFRQGRRSRLAARIAWRSTYLLRRDRWLTIGGLAIVVVVTGAYVLHGAGMGMSALDMTHMARDMEMPQPAWTLEYATLMFAMWWLMMTAMMLPSATPVLLLVTALNRKASPGRRPYGATALFAAGYLVAWAGFSLAAVAAQAGLTANGSLSSMLHVGGRRARRRRCCSRRGCGS